MFQMLHSDDNWIPFTWEVRRLPAHLDPPHLLCRKRVWNQVTFCCGDFCRDFFCFMEGNPHCFIYKFSVF